MRAYSRDLREKIVSGCARQLGSQRAIAALFGVSRSFVEKLLHRYRTSGELDPKPQAGGQKPRLEAAAWPVLRRLVQAHPDATLEELCTHVAAETGIRVSVPTMCRVLQRLRLPRKKIAPGLRAGDRTRSAGAGGLLGTYRPARPPAREVHR